MTPKVISYAERAAFVEVEYPRTDDHELLRSLLQDGVQSVLDIPCDVGRNTLFLARAGVRLFAVDREPAMIEKLAERLAARGDRAAVELRVGDMCDLDLGERFDLIAVQREGFQLITDRDDAARALRAMARHLAPGGTMLVDLATFAPGDAEDEAIAPTYFDPRWPDGVAKEEWVQRLPTGDTVARTRIQRRIDQDRILLSYRYDVRARAADAPAPRAGDGESWVMDVPMAVYSIDGFTALARAAGLVPRAVYRDYQRRPWSPGAHRMIFLLEQDAPAAPLDGDVVGWIKGDDDFVNDRDAISLASFADTPLRGDRLAYFRAFFEAHYHDAFIAGMGTEHLLAALRRVGAAGRWLDLGAGTTTLLWSIPLRGITSITCADLVVEALAVLHDVARSGAVPGCYADVLAMFGSSVDELAATRRLVNRYLVLDALSRWPAWLSDERFDLITAFGCFGMAPGAECYVACFGHAAAHLAEGGRFVGADWVRRPEYIERDGHDNGYLDRALVARAAEAAGLRVLDCERAPIAGDPCYEALLIWTLGAPGAV